MGGLLTKKVKDLPDDQREQVFEKMEENKDKYNEKTRQSITSMHLRNRALSQTKDADEKKKIENAMGPDIEALKSDPLFMADFDALAKQQSISVEESKTNDIPHKTAKQDKKEAAKQKEAEHSEHSEPSNPDYSTPIHKISLLKDFPYKSGVLDMVHNNNNNNNNGGVLAKYDTFGDNYNHNGYYGVDDEYSNGMTMGYNNDNNYYGSIILGVSLVLDSVLLMIFICLICVICAGIVIYIANTLGTRSRLNTLRLNRSRSSRSARDDIYQIKIPNHDVDESDPLNQV